MKVKLAIATPTVVVRIRSKSRAKGTKLHTESASSYTPSIVLPATAEARNASIDTVKPKGHRQRSCSKLHCEHKSKKAKETLHENEYYNTTGERLEWRRERQ
jgi:hypothetical protein